MGYLVLKLKYGIDPGIKLSMIRPKTDPKVGLGVLLPSKRMSDYYLSLYELALQIINLCPSQSTYNPYNRLKENIELPDHLPKEKMVFLYDKLLHAITLLNRPYRSLSIAKVVSTREDVVITLSLIRPVVFPNTLVSKQVRSFFMDLTLTFEKEEVFTSREAAKKLDLPYYTVVRRLVCLREAGWVSLIKTGKYNQFYYCLKEE